MASAIAALPQNGFAFPNAQKLASEIEQYDKVLKLREEIVNGKHPRIKLDVSTSVRVAVGASTTTQSNGTVNLNHVPAQHTALPGLSTLPSTPSTTEPSSKAKALLERQRLERDLGQAVHKEQEVSRRREIEEEFLPSFDVTEVFYQAQELIKPLTQQSSGAHRRGSDSASVEDSTFYSSGVPTDASDEQNNTKKVTTRPCRFFFENGSCIKGDHCNWSHDPAFKPQLQKKPSSPNRSNNRNGHAAKGGRIRESPTYNNNNNNNNNNNIIEDGEIGEEPPYSPSMNIAIEDLSQSQIYSHLSRGQPAFNRTPTHGSRPVSRQQQRRYSPRGKEPHVVRNQITSPVAPQPSRVSPLATAKVPRIDRGRDDGYAARQQPLQPTQPRSRKRRRDHENDDNIRNVAPRTTMASPEPYIKPEPVSPPPFSSLPQFPRRESGTFDRSPRYNASALDNPHDAVSSLDRSLRAPPTPLSSSAHRRVVSGNGIIGTPRRQQDLRRIVSTRNLEHPTSPGYQGISRPRTSLQYMDELAATHRASVEPQRQPQYQEDRHIQPNVRYTRRMDAPELIPLPPSPPGRIVVDEYGNRYLETSTIDRRPAMASEPRYVDEIRRRPEIVEETMRGSARPEPRYYEEAPIIRNESRYYDERPSYQAESTHASRGSVHPEVRYYEERPEPRFYEEAPSRTEPRMVPRGSLHPEARAEAVFTQPTFEQLNHSARPAERSAPIHNSKYDDNRAPRAPSPPLIRQPAVDYRASVQPSSRPIYERGISVQPVARQLHDQRATAQPSSRAMHEPERIYHRPEYVQSSNMRNAPVKVDEYGRMTEDVGRMSVRPSDGPIRVENRPVQHAPSGYRVSVAPEPHRIDGRAPHYVPISYRASAAPEQQRIDHLGSQGYKYAPSQQESYGRQYIPADRQPLPSASRPYDGGMYIN